MEYLTRYPKTISFFDGFMEKISADSKNGVEQLTIVVKKKCGRTNENFFKGRFYQSQIRT